MVRRSASVRSAGFAFEATAPTPLFPSRRGKRSRKAVGARGARNIGVPVPERRQRSRRAVTAAIVAVLLVGGPALFLSLRSFNGSTFAVSAANTPSAVDQPVDAGPPQDVVAAIAKFNSSDVNSVKGVIANFSAGYGDGRCWIGTAADFPDKTLLTVIWSPGVWVRQNIHPQTGPDVNSTRSGSDYRLAGSSRPCSTRRATPAIRRPRGTCHCHDRRRICLSSSLLWELRRCLACGCAVLWVVRRSVSRLRIGTRRTWPIGSGTQTSSDETPSEPPT